MYILNLKFFHGQLTTSRDTVFGHFDHEVDFYLFRKSCLINLLIWSTLSTTPRVNWVKYGQIWAKIEIAGDRGKINQF